MRLLPNRIQQVIFAIFTLVFLLLFSVTPLKVFAQTATLPSYYPNPNFENGVQPTVSNYMQGMVISMLSSISCLLAGVDPISPTGHCLGVIPQTGKLGFISDNSHGAIGMLGNGINGMITSPLIHTSDFTQYLASNFGFAKKSYAAAQSQGVGFAGLSPLLNTWVVLRNIAYLFCILGFVGIGFAIMLRVKIDPRTVMTIQNSIPKIIIGLIFITFSYAIAGLLVDAMYITVGVIYNVYASVPGIKVPTVPSSTNAPVGVNILQNNTPLGVLGQLGTGVHDTYAVRLGCGIPSQFLGITLPVPGHSIHIDLLPSDGCIINSAATGWGIGSIAAEVGFAMGQSFNQILGIHTQQIDWQTLLGNLPGDVVPDVYRAGAIKNILGDVHNIDIINGLIDFGAFIATNKLDSSFAAQSALTGGWGVHYTYMQAFIRNLVPALIVFVIMFVAMLISMIRLFFALLQAWITSLFYIVLGPFMILFGFIPKSKTGFGSWFRGIIAHLLTFPVATGILLVGNIFVQTFSDPTVKDKFFLPPLLGGNALPVGPLIAIGTFFIAANSVAIAKGLVGYKDDKNTAGAFGVGVGGGIKVATSTGKGISEFTAPVPGGQPGQRTGWRAFTREFLR